MIEFVTGSLFESDADCIVAPVNCVGTMGKGLALAFKQKYPELFTAYKYWCQHGDLVPGKVIFWSSIEDPLTTICLFPTKDHWRNPSTVSMIDAGLRNFLEKIKDEDIQSVAFPMLGSGLGGLNFEHQVLPLFVRHLHTSSLHTTIHIVP